MTVEAQREGRSSIPGSLKTLVAKSGQMPRLLVMVFLGVAVSSIALLSMMFHESVIGAIDKLRQENDAYATDKQPLPQLSNTVKVYRNSDYGFSVAYPRGWDAVEGGRTAANGESSIVTFLGRDENGYTPKIEVNNENMQGKSFTIYLRAYDENLADNKDMSDHRIIEKYPYYSAMPDRPTGQYYHYISTTNGSSINIMQVIIPHNGQVFILTASSSGQDAEKYDSVFLQTFNALRFVQ